MCLKQGDLYAYPVGYKEFFIRQKVTLFCQKVTNEAIEYFFGI